MRTDERLVGKTLMDTACGKVGEVVDISGQYVLLVPPGGGAPWPAHPYVLRELTDQEASAPTPAA
jgi:hypothetical protein